jgi:hypothetical protein
MTHSLPESFAVLEPFVGLWAAGTTAERAALRGTSSPEERTAFFEAASPLMDAALDYLDTRNLRDLSAADQRLMNLILSLAHVAQAVEIQGPDEAAHAPWRERMRITRSTADS